jgi:tRNA(His) 5'-end guanylyltransferase
MKDELGQRMKENYELRTRTFLPRRTYSIIRLDGKSFHTYTKGLTKPFDYDLISDMDNATIEIMSQIQGSQFAYVQSDEISILLTDFEKETTHAWFDGNVQKITSVSASLITAEFNRLRWARMINTKGGRQELDDTEVVMSEFDFKSYSTKQIAYFDSRVFTIPDRTEVMNYFIWRNQDSARNSVSMVAQSLYSHSELDGKNTAEKQEMIYKKTSKNWSFYPESDKNGRLIVKETYAPETPENSISQLLDGVPVNIKTHWVSRPAWKFTQDKNKLLQMIPQYS